jgi:hypothetical protein
MEPHQSGTAEKVKTAPSAADRDRLPSLTVPMNFIDRSIVRATTDFVDRTRMNAPTEQHQIRVYDARPIVQSVSLDQEGFTLQPNPTRVWADPELMEANKVRRVDAPPINHAYWNEMIPLIQALTGARDVIPQTGGITARRSAKAREEGWVAQVGTAHADVTKPTVDAFLEKALEDLGRTAAPYSRIAFVQTWQVVSPPPHDSMLGLVDRRTAKPADFVFNDCHFGTSGTVLDDFESRSARYSPDHRWYYFSDMTPQEVLVFKGYDSANTDGDNYIHGAFDNPAAEVLPRSSVEARYIVLYD